MDCLPYYKDLVQKLRDTWDGVSMNGPVEQLTVPQLSSNRDIFVWLHPPIPEISTHSHDFFELIYVYRGSCVNRVDQASYPMQEGDLCILNSHAVHCLRVSQPEKAYIFNILVGKTIVNDAFFHLFSSEDPVASFFLNSVQTQNSEHNCILFHRTGPQSTYELLAQKIIEEFAASQIYRKEMLYYTFVSLLIELTRSRKEEINQLGNNHALSEVLEYISDHCDTVDIASLAAHFSYHPKYIPSLIRKHTGQSFTELLTDIRMKKAATLLVQTRTPVSGICEAVGYSNRSWFLRKFKEKYRCTPTEYRQSNS